MLPSKYIVNTFGKFRKIQRKMLHIRMEAFWKLGRTYHALIKAHPPYKYLFMTQDLTTQILASYFQLDSPFSEQRNIFTLFSINLRPPNFFSLLIVCH
jgi:hypothetical protein